MFARILRHEWRSLTADATLWAVAAAFAASIGYGMWNGVRWVEFQRHAIAEAAAEEAARYDAIAAQITSLNSGVLRRAGGGHHRARHPGRSAWTGRPATAAAIPHCRITRPLIGRNRPLVEEI